MTNWRPVARGLYFAAPDGTVIDAEGNRVKPHRDLAGRLRVTLTVNGTEHDELVHDLVRQLFDPVTERARAMVAVGFPAADDFDDPWSTDLMHETTTDLTRGHPLAGRSPWGQGE